MNTNEIRFIWSKIANEVESVSSTTCEEYIKRNSPISVDAEIDLGYHYKVCDDIKNDPDFRRKFEQCAKRFL